MRLQLVTLSGVKLDQEVYEVIIPTPDGEIAVFPDHEPLITVATTGAITVKLNKDDLPENNEYFAITGGIVEITGKVVKVLVDEAEHGEDIVESETQAALQRAIEMRDNAIDQIELERVHSLVDRHAVRLRVADLHRRRRRH
ncbi:MAG: ATP synthase F1 subunit epsilon [Candidatus Saccharimonadaceae bacterium]